MSQKVWHVLGGLVIGAFIALLVGFIRSPAVREIGGMWVGGILALALWLIFVLKGIYEPNFGSESYLGTALGAVGFTLWVALVTILFTRSDLALLIVPVATWIGMVVLLGVIIFGAIKLIGK